MATTVDSLFDIAVGLMVVRLLHYSEVMEKRDLEAMDKAERFVRRSIMLAHTHEHDVEKLLDIASQEAEASGINDKRRKYIGFIVYDMKVSEGIITRDTENISLST